jgi:hypothetical protein
MEGYFNSSTRGPIPASRKTKTLMYDLRIATEDVRIEATPEGVKALANARADIVEYIGKLERNQLPEPSLNMREFMTDLAAFGTAAIEVPPFRTVPFSYEERAKLREAMRKPPKWIVPRWTRVDWAYGSDFTRIYQTKVEPLRVHPNAVEGIA